MEKIREGLAKNFLLKEIQMLNPKFIVSQSNDVANFVEDLLARNGKLIAKKSTVEFKTQLPPLCTNSPKFKKFDFNGNIMVHLRLPHLASGMTNEFWIPGEKNKIEREARLKGLKSELDEFTIDK